MLHKIIYLFFIRILNIHLISKYLNKNKITIISYHNPSYSILEKHLEYLNSKYNSISIDDLYEYYYSKKIKSLPNNSLIITFDDGYQQNAELLPLFIHYKVKPVIYCCSDIIASNHIYWDKALKESPDKYKKISNHERLKLLKEKGVYTKDMEKLPNQGLSKEDINIMDKHVIWGNHTKTHVILPQCSHSEKQDEIIEAKKQMEKLLPQHTISHFAYPSGCYDEETINVLKQAGFKTARSTDVGWNDKYTNPFKLKVIGISDDANMTKFKFQLSGLSMWLQYFKHGSIFGKNNNFIMKK